MRVMAAIRHKIDILNVNETNTNIVKPGVSFCTVIASDSQLSSPKKEENMLNI